MKQLSSLFGLALLLVACGGGGSSEGTPPPPPSPLPLVAPGDWVVLGSSTAAGVGASAGRSWVARLAAEHAGRAVGVHNLARSGLLTPQALPVSAPAGGSRPAPDPTLNIDRALSLNPKLVLLSFPTNDTASGYPPAETIANLRSLRRRATEAGVATLLLGTQPRDALNAAGRAALAEIDRDARDDPCFVPLFDALVDAEGRIAARYAAGDGIHLNDAGHALVLERVQAVLNGGRCVRLR